jgi:DUF4097 and DUF4098 domain-containing protein YvlB
MRRFWSLAGICAAMGILLMGVGYAMGGSTAGFYIDRNGLHTGAGRSRDAADAERLTRNFDRISNLYIDVTSARVDIVTGPYGISIENNSAPEIGYTIDSEGNLRVTQGSVGLRIFGFYVVRGNRVTVSIPAGSVLGEAVINLSSGNLGVERIDSDDLIVRLSSGNSRINNAAVTNQLTLVSSSGNASLKNIQAAQIEMTLSSGRTDIENVTANSISLRTTSGNANINNCEADSFDIQLSSGTLRGNGIVSRQAFNARLRSGNTTLDGVFEGHTDIRSSSGTVRLTVDGRETDYSRSMSASSGTIRVNGDRHTGSVSRPSAPYSIEINVSSGNVHLDFTK